MPRRDYILVWLPCIFASTVTRPASFVCRLPILVQLAIHNFLHREQPLVAAVMLFVIVGFIVGDTLFPSQSAPARLNWLCWLLTTMATAGAGSSLPLRHGFAGG
jgi:hypothetical protein